MANVTIDQVTTTIPTGDGVFDVLMRSVDSHLDKQYMSGRIKGTEYATVYLGAMQTVLQQAIAFLIAQQQVTRDDAIAAEQIAASQANTAVKQAQSEAQVDLLERQTQGFDEDAQYKIYKSLIDLRTTGMTQEMAGLVNDKASGIGGANQLVNSMLASVGITGINNIVADVV